MTTDYKSDEKYLRYKAFGIVCGLISLFSFWIVVVFAYLLHSTGIIGAGHYGPAGIVIANIPTMFVLAIGGIIAAIWFRAKAVEIRKNLSGNQPIAAEKE
jgi:uncharacterized RDD family membrane protein YckC